VDKAAERARRFRALAEEMRASAGGMNDPEAQGSLLRLAGSYELMADHAEALAETKQRKEQKI
jgi:hypothetical protein